MKIIKKVLRFAAEIIPTRHVLFIAMAAAGTATAFVLISGENAEANRTEVPLTLQSVGDKSVISLETLPAPAAIRKQPLNSVSALLPAQTVKTEPLAEASETSTPIQQAITPKLPPVTAWQKSVVRSGDNLSDIFARNNLSATDLYRILQTKHGSTLTDIRPGQTLYFGRIDGDFTGLRYHSSRLESITYLKDGNKFNSEELTREPDIRTTYAQGIIDDSLFLAATNAGLTDTMTMALANIFGWDIDFVMDIREGDSFNLIYEEKYLDGVHIGYGDIIAASFTNQGKVYEAVYFTDSHGNSGYFSPEGKSMKKSFLRTPVDFTRISSRYNPNRLHPIFKTKRPHRAVDYAAPTGTPIKAAGDGVVSFSGYQKGYGNVVFIKHPNNIVTIYAHQSKIARSARKGRKVSQGQTIGYVGSTGYATGPHLHYEFRVNGVHRNPLTVKLPQARPLPKSEMAEFQRAAGTMIAELQKHSATVLAAAQDDKTNVTQ